MRYRGYPKRLRDKYSSTPPTKTGQVAAGATMGAVTSTVLNGIIRNSREGELHKELSSALKSENKIGVDSANRALTSFREAAPRECASSLVGGGLFGGGIVSAVLGYVALRKKLSRFLKEKERRTEELKRLSWRERRAQRRRLMKEERRLRAGGAVSSSSSINQVIVSGSSPTQQILSTAVRGNGVKIKTRGVPKPNGVKQEPSKIKSTFLQLGFNGVSRRKINTMLERAFELELTILPREHNIHHPPLRWEKTAPHGKRVKLSLEERAVLKHFAPFWERGGGKIVPYSYIASQASRNYIPPALLVIKLASAVEDLVVTGLPVGIREEIDLVKLRCLIRKV